MRHQLTYDVVIRPATDDRYVRVVCTCGLFGARRRFAPRRLPAAMAIARAEGALHLREYAEAA